MKNLITTATGVAIFAACVAGAGALTSPINEQRQELNLTISDEVWDLPPEMAVTQAALGVGRGIAINVAWQRAESLKQEGKFHEAVDLGLLITRLQPRFPQVWEFVSWNQAYNISVGTQTPEERWRWVKSGIDVLQNKGGGIDANPNSMRLYLQLAWIYHHKIGMFQDNFNWFYKRQVADEWNAILGEPPLDMDDYVAWLEPVVNAPDRASDLPEGARKLLAWVLDQGFEQDVEMLRAFTVEEQRIEYAPEEIEAIREAGETPVYYRTAASFPDWASEADRKAVLDFVRKEVIADDEHNMEPKKMLADAEFFGPLDWRHPASHAIYWIGRGVEREEDGELRSTDGVINSRRQIFNSLEQLAQQGNVVYDPIKAYVSYMPIGSFWLDYDDYYQQLAELYPEGAVEKTWGPGYRSRMDAAIADSELIGDTESAQALLDLMADRYAGTDVDHYDTTLDAFLEQQYADTIDNPDKARIAMQSLLLQSRVLEWVEDDREKAELIRERALDLFNGYRELNPNRADPQYMEVSEFPAMEIETAGAFLAGYHNSDGNSRSIAKLGDLPITLRSAVWTSRLSEAEREAVWARWEQQLMQSAYDSGYDPLVVFPPPANVQNVLVKPVTSEEREEMDGSSVDRANQEAK